MSSEVNKASKNETAPAALKAAKRSPLTSLVTPSVTLKYTVVSMVIFFSNFSAFTGKILCFSPRLRARQRFW